MPIYFFHAMLFDMAAWRCCDKQTMAATPVFVLVGLVCHELRMSGTVLFEAAMRKSVRYANEIKYAAFLSAVIGYSNNVSIK